MFNNKYSKTLTVILIIVIIVIVGLLIYFGIDVYKKFYIDQASGDAFHEFQNQFNETNTNEINPEQNNIITNNVDTNIDLNSLYQNTITVDPETPEDPNSQGVVMTYKGFDIIGSIEIPAIDVEYLIIPEYQSSTDALNVAIVMLYPSNKGLNEIGNTVLAGHNYRDGSFFSNNKRLQLGDKIYITDASGNRVEYEVTKKYETSTGDSSYMNRDTNGKREISLTTCTDDTRRRLIIWAAET